MNHNRYPDVFPADEVASLVGYLRGDPHDPKGTLFAAHVVEGYALGAAVGQPCASDGRKDSSHPGRSDQSQPLLPGEPAYQARPLTPAEQAAKPGGGAVLTASEQEAKAAHEAQDAKDRLAQQAKPQVLQPASKEEQAAALEALSRAMGVGTPTTTAPVAPITKEEQAKALEALSAAMSATRALPCWLLPLAHKIKDELIAVVCPAPVVPVIPPVPAV